ncbi:hypothetical protein GCK32_001934 [Trichostrongylus colubriformis]|uniref:Uncharacterized protein n=1 Tax=Trichostrongylus colubriformis TaxID=6319 RepID=A0AAN8FDQ9_TRICO
MFCTPRIHFYKTLHHRELFNRHRNSSSSSSTLNLVFLHLPIWLWANETKCNHLHSIHNLVHTSFGQDNRNSKLFSV